MTQDQPKDDGRVCSICGATAGARARVCPNCGQPLGGAGSRSADFSMDGRDPTPGNRPVGEVTAGTPGPSGTAPDYGPRASSNGGGGASLPPVGASRASGEGPARGRFWVFARRFTLGCLGTILVLFLPNLVQDAPWHAVTSFLMGTAAVSLLCFWTFSYFWAVGVRFWDGFRVACRDVPPVDVLAAQLRAQTGQEPSIQDIAAYQQILATQRNQALINTAIYLDAFRRSRGHAGRREW